MVLTNQNHQSDCRQTLINFVQNKLGKYRYIVAGHRNRDLIHITHIRITQTLCEIRDPERSDVNGFTHELRGVSPVIQLWEQRCYKLYVSIMPFFFHVVGTLTSLSQWVCVDDGSFKQPRLAMSD